ncbi:MAG: LecA/PA-IL family lectin, partial [Actinomycetota bacterium]|nr:LecA/PA-IL family lectin [Actinomycetota bacterium]
RKRRGPVVVVGLLLVAALAAALGFVVLSGDGGGASRREVVVDGTRSWSDTGIELSVGDQVRVTAAGSVFHNESSSIGPEGFPNRPDLLTPLDRANHAGLLARVGDTGEAFYVGRGASFTADRDGRLFLGINDGGLENNRGSFTATVEVGG